MKIKAIYTLSVECIGGIFLTEEFRFVMEVPADSTLGDLAFWILDTAEFDGDHWSEFYLASGPGARRRTSLAGGRPHDDSPMDDIGLRDIFPLAKKQLLYYAYDPGAGWGFKIAKQGTETLPQVGVEYPRVVEEHGDRPIEYGPDDDGDEDGDADERKG